MFEMRQNICYLFFKHNAAWLFDKTRSSSPRRNGLQIKNVLLCLHSSCGVWNRFEQPVFLDVMSSKLLFKHVMTASSFCSIFFPCKSIHMHTHLNFADFNLLSYHLLGKVLRIFS